MSWTRDEFRQGQIAIAALFCFLGFQYATWASRLPDLKSRLQLTEAELGLLLMACGIGAAASFPLVSILMKRLGSRRLAIMSAVCLVLLLLALAMASNYLVALVIICCDGIAVGCLNVAMNAQGAALEVAYERTAMAKFHATFSGGSLGGALIASGVNVSTSSLIVHFGAAGVILLLLIGISRPGLLMRDQDQDQDQHESRSFTFTRPSVLTLWMGCAMAFGTVVEGAMNDWSALYMRNVAKATADQAPLGIAVVSVMMVLARLFADSWRSRWGDGLIVRLGASLAGVGLALALLAGGIVPTLIGFACVGLGIASVTPCIYVAAAKQGSDALALVAAMGTTGLLAGPAIIGFISSGSSLVWGMGAVALSAILVTLCATQIRWTALSSTQ